jgi:hypothetical protein
MELTPLHYGLFVVLALLVSITVTLVVWMAAEGDE